MPEVTVVYSLEEPPKEFSKSIFLAGPTPRSDNVLSWRQDALKLLRLSGYDGVAFVPEDEHGMWHGDHAAQVEWEEKCLHMADCILFWVPRDMACLPGLTTNDEWGVWKDSGKVVFGAPSDAPSTRYQVHYAHKLSVPAAASLDELIELAVIKIGAGALRVDGEREVPLAIWQTKSFQDWYANLKVAGNQLMHARQVWTIRSGPARSRIFLWAMHVDIYVASENRHKTNEVVIARPDISTIVMYKRADTLDDTIVVLVREFRSPVSNEVGFVYELAGGSSYKPGVSPQQLAADEATEETGLMLEASRIKVHEARQMLATLLAHKAHLFSVEITDQELEQLQNQYGMAFGIVEDSERTYVEVTTVGEILNSPNVDWAMFGMIMRVLT